MIARLPAFTVACVLLLMLSFAAGGYWNTLLDLHEPPVAAATDRLAEHPADSSTPEQHLLARNTAASFPVLLPVERKGRTLLLFGSGGELLAWMGVPGAKSGHLQGWIGSEPFPARRSSAPLFLLNRNLRT